MYHLGEGVEVFFRGVGSIKQNKRNGVSLRNAETDMGCVKFEAIDFHFAIRHKFYAGK